MLYNCWVLPLLLFCRCIQNGQPLLYDDDLNFCPTASDTSVILDSSGSVSPLTFELAKKFVMHVVAALAANPNSRQAVYNCEESPQTILKLEEQPTLPEIVQTLEKNLTHTDGYTWMERAINLAVTDLQQWKRKNAPLNLVILSDGNFQDKGIFGYPARAALAAMEGFVSIYVVAIGDHDMTELKTITDDSRQIYLLTEGPDIKLLDNLCIFPLPPPTDDCGQALDIIFIPDSSASMTPEGFEVARDVTRRLQRTYLGNKNVRSGLIQFSNEATLIFSIADTISPYRRDRLVMTNLTFEDGYSFTEYAISMARGILEENKRAVPRIMVLLSDGKSNFPEKVIDEAHRALELGIDIFALQFGDGNSTELEVVTDYTERVFHFGDGEIEKLVNRMSSGICPPPPTPSFELPVNCFNSMKIVIVLESSGEMGESSFMNAKQLVRQLAKWARGVKQNKVALATFGTDVRPVVTLSDDLSVFKMDSKIRHVKFQPDPKAIIVGAVSWSRQQHEMDMDKGSNVLLIVGSGYTDVRQQDIILSLKARESGINIFAISFGDMDGFRHLRAIVGSPSKVWKSGSCEGKKMIAREASIEMCPRNTTSYKPPIPCTLDSDLVVVLDTSKSFNVPNYKFIKQFTALLLSKFPASSNSLVGLVTAGREPKVWLKLNPKYSWQIVSGLVKGIPYAGGELQLSEAIRSVRIKLYGGSYRYFIPKTLLFINNEATSYSSMDVGQATTAEQQRINLVTIGIGDSINKEGLQLIAGSQEDAFFVDKHAALLNLLQSISLKTCNKPWIPEPSTCPEPSDVVFLVDASADSGEYNFKHTTEFVARILQAFMANGVGRVGVLTYGGFIKTIVKLNAQKSLQEMQNIVLNAKFSAGESKAKGALQQAMMMFGLGRECRQGQQGKATSIVFVSHSVADIDATIKEADKIRSQYVNVFVLAVGNQLSSSDAGRLAGSKENMHLVSGHQELFSAMVAISTLICKRPPRLPCCPARFRQLKDNNRNELFPTGDNTYACRYYHYDGDVVPGRLEFGAQPNCHTTVSGKAYRVSDRFVFDTLLNNPDYRWAEGGRGVIPGHSVPVGKTRDGETLYMALATIRGHSVAGKVGENLPNDAFFELDGKEEHRVKFLVLVCSS